MHVKKMKRPEQKLTLQAMRLNIRAILIVAGYNRKLNNMALSKLYPLIRFYPFRNAYASTD